MLELGNLNPFGLRRLNAKTRDDAASPIVKRIICLANSRKRSGRCIAGKELNGDGHAPWVRPVSDRPDQEVSEQERIYKDRSEPRVLDIVDIPLREHRPKSHQSENWLLDPRRTWARTGRATWNDLFSVADNPAWLWKNGSSTYHGWNDRVSVADCQKLHSSLYLLHLSSMKYRLYTPGAEFGKWVKMRHLLAAILWIIRSLV